MIDDTIARWTFSFCRREGCNWEYTCNFVNGTYYNKMDVSILGPVVNALIAGL